MKLLTLFQPHCCTFCFIQCTMRTRWHQRNWQVCVLILQVKKHNLPLSQYHFPVFLCARPGRVVQVVDYGPPPKSSIYTLLLGGQLVNLLGNACKKYKSNSLVRNSFIVKVLQISDDDIDRQCSRIYAQAILIISSLCAQKQL